MNTGPLGLQEAEFWSDPYKTRDEVYQRLSEEDFIGLVVDAPAQVNIEEHQTLPVIGCRSAAVWQARRANFSRFGLITALQPKTGRLLADRAQTPRIFSETIPADDSDPGEGVIMSLFDLDLRERLPKLPWEPGTYLLTVILQDQVSNRLLVNLVSSQPRVSDRLAEVQDSTISPPPDDPLPSYRSEKDSLPLPKAMGISLNLETRVVLRPQTKCVLRGSYRLPLRLQHLLGMQTQDSPPEAEEQEVAAIIPLTLLLTGSESPGPFLISMRVPCYDRLASDSLVAEVTGVFAIDLFETD